ncbi:endo-1,4-beta-xylanase [Aureimonas sp. ME7]|uniref:endo-1,4-beta-xylanase n=1 Tax=Aureimonas sp. ME7 TaxID=2744252 RepID=UPI0015FD9D43|nr:endo-1,4-beta-xylanase [Aureimonas sp. ME7]
MNRREFLNGAAALAGTAAIGPSMAAAAAQPSSLRQRAEAKGLLFGCAVKSTALRNDPDYVRAILEDADILVHEYELKRKNVEPKEGQYTFEGADAVMDFAGSHGLKVRGHTLCWYAANPDWLANALQGPMAERERLLVSYIQTVMDRYRGKMQSWDVVNEAVEPDQWNWNGMRRDNVWWQAFGEDYIGLAFRTAKEHGDGAPLYLCDYGVESDVRWNERRRTAILNLIERLRARDVPIDGFAIQGHLKPFQASFEPEVFARFMRELEGFGLQTMVSELDVADIDGPDDPGKRDAEVAAVTKSFLDTALSFRSMTGVLCWGISDRYSWMSDIAPYKRADGTRSRVLPYDDGYRRKPMWQAIADALDGAPARGS